MPRNSCLTTVLKIVGACKNACGKIKREPTVAVVEAEGQLATKDVILGLSDVDAQAPRSRRRGVLT